MLNIMMTVDFLFLLKAALRFIYLLMKPLSSKLLTPPSTDKKKFVYSLKIVHWRRSLIGIFLANHGSDFFF